MTTPPPLHYSLPSDEWTAFNLTKQKNRITDRLALNVHCTTYNLAGKDPKQVDDSDLHKALGLSDQKVGT